MPDAIIIPVFNQWAYTESCLADLRQSVEADTKIVVVDNGSTDETCECLGNCGGVIVIRNSGNRGFAGACNQGIEASAGCRWRIFLNNDVLLSRGWYHGLLSAADQYRIDLISPAMREGPLNYDIAERATLLRQKLGDHLRRNVAHGVCFAVRDRVFRSIGCFDESFRIGQYEEADFYRRARQAGFALATTGRSFIHHFSSVTQKAITISSPSKHGQENQKYYRKKWRLNWLRRKKEKLQDAIILKRYIRMEKRLARTVLIDRSL